MTDSGFIRSPVGISFHFVDFMTGCHMLKISAENETSPRIKRLTATYEWKLKALTYEFAEDGSDEWAFHFEENCPDLAGWTEI